MNNIWRKASKHWYVCIGNNGKDKKSDKVGDSNFGIGTFKKEGA